MTGSAQQRLSTTRTRAVGARRTATPRSSVPRRRTVNAQRTAGRATHRRRTLPGGTPNRRATTCLTLGTARGVRAPAAAVTSGGAPAGSVDVAAVDGASPRGADGAIGAGAGGAGSAGRPVPPPGFRYGEIPGGCDGPGTRARRPPSSTHSASVVAPPTLTRPAATGRITVMARLV